MSWHPSLVQSVEQFVVTQLSELGSSRLNMDVLSVDTSGPSIHLCWGILWLFWDANWEILVCLCQLCQLIVQHLEWLITTQDVVRLLILILFLLGIMSNSLFHRWLWNHLSWHVFIRPHGMLQTLKWGSWFEGNVEIMLSFMLCSNTNLSWSLKAQKSSVDWWCCFLVGRCCWMKSTILSCLLILGLRRCMLCCLPVYGGHTCEFLVSKFVSLVRFGNMLRTAHKHPQDCWHRYPLL